MKKYIVSLLITVTVLLCLGLTVSSTASTGEVVSDEGRLPFEDVKDSHWFADALEFCYANGIIKGMDDYTFGFSGQLTRAQFVTMLASLEGVDTSAYTIDKFTDIKDTYWYYGAVAWAYNEGIINGMTDDTFAGTAKLTRAQLAVIMSNYMQSKYDVAVEDTALDRFTDRPKSSYWYYEAMKYSVSAGIISGNSNGTLTPTGNVTRAQAAVIFKSFAEKYYFGSCEHSFTEADCTKAQVCQRCGIVNGIPDGHILTAYDCVTGGICTVCGTEVGPSNRLHDYKEATCTDPMTCLRCAAVRGKANGHKWIAASCFTPKTCKICDYKQGLPLGHSTDIGRCTRCGYEYYPTPFSKAVYFMKSRTEYSDSAQAYISLKYLNDGELWIWYYDYSECFKIEYIFEKENGNYEWIALYLTSDVNSCTFDYKDVVDKKVGFVGYGHIVPAKFTSDTAANISSYQGGSKQDYIDRVNLLLHKTIEETDKVLYKMYGGSVYDLGFKVY